MIYFLECVEAQAVKIGYARNSLTKRIEGLQCGCPFVLELRGAINGDRNDEARVHTAVSSDGGGFRGEWFQAAPALKFLALAEAIGLTGALDQYEARAVARRDAIRVSTAEFMASLRARGFTDPADFMNAALRDPALAAELHAFADLNSPGGTAIVAEERAEIIPLLRKSAASARRAIG